jgi:hypothetical protein
VLLNIWKRVHGYCEYDMSLEPELMNAGFKDPSIPVSMDPSLKDRFSWTKQF